MDAKTIYDKLLKQGIPEKLVTWSNKADSIDILIQDYNEKVYKEALKFFKDYKGVRVDYTIDHETALWCDDVSKYSSDELIRSLTDFYYTLRAKGLAYTESKTSSRKSLKESQTTELSYSLQGVMKTLSYFLNDLQNRPSKRNANDVIRQANNVQEYCEALIRELERAIKRNEI